MNPTLQVLDAGVTFYRQLEEGPIVIGSGSDVDLRLSGDEVAPRHARIEAGDDGSFRIVDLGTEPGTRVNGEDVAQWKLAIGDRIEIGSAVLVVGRTVPRKATPADVLADEAGIGRAAAEVRREVVRRTAPAAPKRRLSVPAIAAIVLAVAAGLFLITRGGDSLPVRWGDLVAMRREGNVEDGRALAAQLRATWAKDDPQRNAQLDSMVGDFDAIAEGLAGGRARIRAEAATASRMEQFDELQEQRRRGENAIAGIVARRLLSELDELRYATSTSVPDAVATGDLRGGSSGNAKTPESAAPEASATAAPEPTEAERFVRDQLVAIDELREAGRWGEALETMRLSLTNTAAEHAAPLREARIRLEAEIGREMRKVVQRARETASGGVPADVDRAIAMLREESLRFPTEGEFVALVAEQKALEDYRAELDRRGSLAEAATPPATELAEFRELIVDARREERAGEFATAAAIVGRAADAMRAADPLYAASLDGRRADLLALAALGEHVSSEIGTGRTVVVELEDRGAAQLVIDGDRLCAAGTDLEWSAVTPASLAALLAASEPGTDALIGGAVHAYRAGDRDTAEQLLAQVVRGDSGLQPKVDGVIARGRGETLDSGGYRLVDGSFVAVREIEVHERAKELERTVVRIAGLAEGRRDAELDEILAKGPKELDALLIALRSAAATAVARIENDGFRRHWERVAQDREQLDAARRHAIELIFDEQRYFYPYRPPAVSVERASEYQKVQHDVDERVAAVREVWEADGPKKRVPKSLLERLAQFDWIVSVLGSFGERLPELEERVSWARALPAEGALELKTFAWNAHEARERREWDKVIAFNAAKGESLGLSTAERRQVEITNAYRLMFGHRPLALNPALLEATRGHAKEMSHLGYFSHFSPTPGRKTPFDRMKLAGYTWGVSENIANHPSAESAHDGWTHSSGHHRNLLMASHREFAVGNDGRAWVQNFGRGEEYLRDPDWAKD